MGRKTLIIHVFSLRYTFLNSRFEEAFIARYIMPNKEISHMYFLTFDL